MASDAKSQQLIVLFKNLNDVDQDSLDRRLTLTRDNPIATVGRSSKRKSELGPSANNAYFDCPVMSREHAEIRVDFDEQTVTIQDSGSLHGTLLNKTGLRPTDLHPLRTGDIISFGLAVDRGSDKFSPREVEAEVIWETRESPPRAVTYSVPDDTDIESISDGEDSAPEMIFAKKTLIANNYQPADHKGKSIDLTSPSLPPISSFDGPSKGGSLVDLTLDGMGAELLRKAGAQSRPELDNNALPPIINIPAVAEPSNTEDHLDEDGEGSSWGSCDGNDRIAALSQLSQLDEDEDVDDFGLSDDYSSGEEADDLWGAADDDLNEFGNEFGAIPDGNHPPIASDSEEEAEADWNRNPSSPEHQAVPPVETQNTGAQPSFAPKDFAFDPDLSKAPNLSWESSTSAADKSAFWSAREQNRKTLGLPTKAEAFKDDGVPNRKTVDLPNNFETSNDVKVRVPDLFDFSSGFSVNMTNELLRTGDKFLNEPLHEPLKASGITQKSVDNQRPDLDETSAFRFEMSKKNASQPAPKEHVQSEAKEHEQIRDTASKRKADEISKILAQEAAPEPLAKTRSVEQTVAQSSSVDVPDLASLAVAPPVVSSCAVNHNSKLPSTADALERPAKRLRRAAEVVGYAAIGGIAVMSALIATAPQL